MPSPCAMDALYAAFSSPGSSSRRRARSRAARMQSSRSSAGSARSSSTRSLWRGSATTSCCTRTTSPPGATSSTSAPRSSRRTTRDSRSCRRASSRGFAFARTAVAGGGHLVCMPACTPDRTRNLSAASPGSRCPGLAHSSWSCGSRLLLCDATRGIEIEEAVDPGDLENPLDRLVVGHEQKPPTVAEFLARAYGFRTP